jgi:hypothetical protein
MVYMVVERGYAKECVSCSDRNGTKPHHGARLLQRVVDTGGYRNKPGRDALFPSE